MKLTGRGEGGKERFSLEMRLVWETRCAFAGGALFSSLLTCRHFLAMIWDLAFILHTLLVL